MLFRSTCSVVVLAIVALLAAAAPVHATATNELFYEPPPVYGGNGGNPTDEQIAQLIADNTALLGVPVQIIGKVDLNPDTFTPAQGTNFLSDMFVSFTCNSVPASGNCADGFTVEFDFSGLAKQWQIVKIVVKADGPDFPWGAFVIDPDALQTPPLDPLQAAFVSSTEYGKYLDDANDLCFAAGIAQCTNNDGSQKFWNPGISHITLFGTPTDTNNVPEPGTLMLLGLGLIVAAVAGPKTVRS